ncbi:MAG: coniferyl aldehyde dehydrogenase [Candidatus Accumulibacter sp.]|uniref:Aldehyde dehydrogenase n=1 Tax=Candidatus Accumulibacter affinis TaxID=2954384 RepID=A0A935W4E1_9PROT|nr:coniferyl aldehyde dehydrogenase [Candidatus Accumulibacter affinis]
MNLTDPQAQLLIPAEFEECLARQRVAYLAEPNPSYAQRVSDLSTLARMLKENQDAIVAAICRDYTNRAEFETLFAEFFICLEGIRDTIKHLKRWMKPMKRHVDFMLYPLAKNRLIPQPLGVVGVITPWNFPLYLAFGPLTGIFAAGNRAMVKMSENSVNLARLLISLSPKYFPADKLMFFEDGGGRGPAFGALPFDHLLFTGSGQTGRAVMAAAARNLTPVTLELGGKAPAIVGADFPIKTAAERLLWVKMFNAGQVCLNVDYLFLPEGRVDEFVEHARRVVAQRYPDINGVDYTSIIDERSHKRLSEMLEDARAKGATLVNLMPTQQADPALRKLAPHLVLNVSEDMQVMQREIFGPILPIRTYRDPEEVVRYITAHDRPLAIYPFTHDKALQQLYIDRVMSGGVSVNEAMMHVTQHDMPFGGVGASGMGHYHGYEGFVTFSKLRPVFYQAPFSVIQMLFLPPYGPRVTKIINLLIRLKG